MPKPSDLPAEPSLNQLARDQFPEHFTFSQRNGELPESMQLEHIPDDLRREVFDAICSFLEELEIKDNEIYKCNEIINFDPEYIKEILSEVCKIPKIDINPAFQSVIDIFRIIILKGDFKEFLDCLEILINKSLKFWEKINKSQKESGEYYSYAVPRWYRIVNLKGKIVELFDKYRSTYQLDTSQRPYWFFPSTSEEEGGAIQQAIETVCQGEMSGAITHIRKAGKFMNEGKYADSIRESIHAVESVARIISPASRECRSALGSSEIAVLVKHKALKEAFIKLYAYTSDEKGIRHALLDQGEADVGLDEAIFMFGACASFAAYLTRKHQNQQTST